MYKDKEKRKECQARWRARHREQLRKYYKEYRQKHRILTRNPESLKKPHFCITCGVYLGDRGLSYRKRHSYCKSCGAKIGVQSQGKQLIQPRFCIECGKPISPQAWRYCQECFIEIHNKHPYIRTPEIREKNRMARRKRWENLETKVADMQAMVKGQHIKPNKSEQKLIALLNEFFPHQWQFTGDGSFWVGELNPDFTATNGKKLVIDLFSYYWHSKPGVPAYKTELGRVKIMRSYDYEDLIIWEYELKDTNALKTKIDRFIKQHTS